MTSLVDRGERLEAVAELIEKEMMLVGATAIEDKLQEGVPDAIGTITLRCCCCCVTVSFRAVCSTFPLSHLVLWCMTLQRRWRKRV
jgi:hypothetical protein